MKTTRLLSGLLLAALLAACNVGKPSATPPVTLDGEWQLRRGTLDGREIPLLPTHPITLRISGNEVSGRAACNHYSGTVDIHEGRWSTGTMAVTQMACEPPEAMELERIFLEALGRAERHRVDGGVLVLEGAGVELVFDLVASPEAAAVDSAPWVLEGLVTGAAISSAVEGGTLVFDTDGTLRVSTGCRELSGSYALDGERLHVDLDLDTVDCPPQVAEQDRHIVEVLDAADRIELDGARSTISAPDGRAVVWRAEGG